MYLKRGEIIPMFVTEFAVCKRDPCYIDSQILALVFEFPALLTLSQHLYLMRYGLFSPLCAEKQHKLHDPEKFLN